MSEWPWPDYDASGFVSDDPGPDVHTMAKNVASGLWCQDCQVEFTKPHDEPVSCTHCINQREELDVKEVVKRARHEEKNRAAHADRARKARKAKESK